MAAVMAATPTVAVPSFVTVTLGPSEPARGPTEPRTMRVPITATTTVRELAKAAMRRYMLSLRRNALKGADGAVQQLCRSGIVVTDVFLLFPSDAARLESGDTGSSAAPSQQVIELFSDDCVVQVVQVMKETVHMRFRAADAIAAAAAPTAAAVADADAGAGASTRTMQGKTNTEAQPTSPPSQTTSIAAPVHVAAQPPCVIEVEETSNTVGSLVAATTSPLAGAPAITAASLVPSDDNDKDAAPGVAACGVSAPPTTSARMTTRASAMKASVVETVVSSRSVSAENSSSRVAPITVSRRQTKPDTTTQRVCSSSSNSSASECDSDSDADDSCSATSGSSADSTVERQRIAQSIATLRQHETQRMRWGPDAHKNFAANYVSSPHKIMKGRYKCGKVPPPSVQLHQHASSSSSCSSPGSVSRTQSPRTMLSDTTHDAPSAAPLATTPPQPPTQPRKRESIDDEAKTKRTPEEATPQARPEPPLKAHCVEARTQASPANTIATRSAMRVAVAPLLPSPEKTRGPWMLPGTAALCTTQPVQHPVQQHQPQTLPQPLPPSASRPSTVLDSAAACTPVSGAVRGDTSPAGPGTVAKPAVGAVARQLCFEEEEEGHTVSKKSVASVCLNTPPICTAPRVSSTAAEWAI